MSYIHLLATLLACRFLDLMSTALCSPDLKLEINPIIRKLGWRRTIILNLTLCPVIALAGPWVVTFACLISIAAVFWNCWQITR